MPSIGFAPIGFASIGLGKRFQMNDDIEQLGLIENGCELIGSPARIPLILLR